MLTFQVSAQVPIYIYIAKSNHFYLKIYTLTNSATWEYAELFVHLGTRPWSKAAGEQRIDDGLIEVIGLSTHQLPMLQVNIFKTWGLGLHQI